MYILADLVVSPLGFVFRLSNKHNQFYLLMQIMTWLSFITLIDTFMDLRRHVIKLRE